MNIAIYDAEHYEGIYPLIKIFGTSQNRLTIFTSSAAIDRLHEMLKGEFFHHKWIIIEPSNRNTKYFRRVKALLRVAKAEFVIFNTIATHQWSYAKLIKKIGVENCLVTVHNINNFFAPSPTVGIKTYINNLGKKYLRKHLIHFNVINETLLPKIKEQLLPFQQVYSIPGGIYEDFQQPISINDKIIIAIPGTVDSNRRHYDQLFTLAAMANEIQLPLEINVVGGFHSGFANDLKEKMRKVQYEHVQIKFTDYAVVPQPVYDENLQQAHFIWLPSVIHFKMENGLPEIYGVTKTSGNVYDIIRTGKPYLSPTALKMPPDLFKSGFHYENLQSLVEYLHNMYQNKFQYDTLIVNAKEASDNYRLERIQDSLPPFLKEKFG